MKKQLKEAESDHHESLAPTPRTFRGWLGTERGGEFKEEGRKLDFLGGPKTL